MKRLVLVLVVCCLASSGCFRYRSQLPGTIRPDVPTEYDVLGDFEVELERRWWLLGFRRIGHEALDEAITRAVVDQGGDGAVQVKIRSEQDAGDVAFMLLNVFLPCGWYSRHMVVSGKVVKFKP